MYTLTLNDAITRLRKAKRNKAKQQFILFEIEKSTQTELISTNLSVKFQAALKSLYLSMNGISINIPDRTVIDLLSSHNIDHVACAYDIIREDMDGEKVKLLYTNNLRKDLAAGYSFAKNAIQQFYSEPEHEHSMLLQSSTCSKLLLAMADLVELSTLKELLEQSNGKKALKQAIITIVCQKSYDSSAVKEYLVFVPVLFKYLQIKTSSWMKTKFLNFMLHEERLEKKLLPVLQEIAEEHAEPYIICELIPFCSHSDRIFQGIGKICYDKLISLIEDKDPNTIHQIHFADLNGIKSPLFRLVSSENDEVSLMAAEILARKVTEKDFEEFTNVVLQRISDSDSLYNEKASKTIFEAAGACFENISDVFHFINCIEKLLQEKASVEKCIEAMSHCLNFETEDRIFGIFFRILKSDIDMPEYFYCSCFSLLRENPNQRSDFYSWLIQSLKYRNWPQKVYNQILWTLVLHSSVILDSTPFNLAGSEIPSLVSTISESEINPKIELNGNFAYDIDLDQTIHQDWNREDFCFQKIKSEDTKEELQFQKIDKRFYLETDSEDIPMIPISSAK